jgi:hypothetical protein
MHLSRAFQIMITNRDRTGNSKLAYASTEAKARDIQVDATKASQYFALLQAPLALLASSVGERADVHSVAILGYN